MKDVECIISNFFICHIVYNDFYIYTSLIYIDYIYTSKRIASNVINTKRSLKKKTFFLLSRHDEYLVVIYKQEKK